jgi:predicted DNA-binding protein (UPF0251 family)
LRGTADDSTTNFTDNTDCVTPSRRDGTLPSLSFCAAANSLLGEREQEAVRLKFEHGLSYREIAGVLGITPNYVGVILHTALNAVRQRLREADERKLDSNCDTQAIEPRSNRS